MYLGNKIYIQDAAKISEEFLDISADDEKAAKLLLQNGCYNQSMYYYIQSMEKFMKGYICKKINVSNPYFADLLRKTGHSLKDTFDLFIEVVAGNDILLREQTKNQLENIILKGIRFSMIYNATRYPFYNSKNNCYCVTKMSREDCDTVNEIYQSLKMYLSKLLSC